jgi:hypothetical protein
MIYKFNSWQHEYRTVCDVESTKWNKEVTSVQHRSCDSLDYDFLIWHALWKLQFLSMCHWWFLNNQSQEFSSYSQQWWHFTSGESFMVFKKGVWLLFQDTVHFTPLIGTISVTSIHDSCFSFVFYISLYFTIIFNFIKMSVTLIISVTRIVIDKNGVTSMWCDCSSVIISNMFTTNLWNRILIHCFQ